MCEYREFFLVVSWEISKFAADNIKTEEVWSSNIKEKEPKKSLSLGSNRLLLRKKNGWRLIIWKSWDTITCVIEAFFEANPEILLYVCETGDGKEAMRNRLFLRWLKDYTQKEIFYVEHVEIEAEGVMNFAAIIVQKSNPCLETIIADFRSAIEELQKPN